MIYWKNELLDLHPIAHWTERGFSLKRDLLFLTILDPTKNLEISIFDFGAT